MIDRDKLYTIKEVADYLGVTRHTIFSKVKNGVLKIVRKPYAKAFFVQGEEILKYVKKSTAGNDWLSVKQVAEILQVRQPAISYLVKQNKLKCYKVQNEKTRVRFLRKDVEDYINNRSK